MKVSTRKKWLCSVALLSVNAVAQDKPTAAPQAPGQVQAGDIASVTVVGPVELVDRIREQAGTALDQYAAAPPVTA